MNSTTNQIKQENIKKREERNALTEACKNYKPFTPVQGVDMVKDVKQAKRWKKTSGLN